MPAMNSKRHDTPRPALFLDRDGVINVDKGYVDTPDGFEFIHGAIDTIAHFNAAGWYVFIVTNQTGIAHGHYTEADMFKVHAFMNAELAKHKAHIDRIYYCPYDLRGSVTRYCVESDDRKPEPGMILKAMRDFPVDAKSSILIGDKDKDLQAGKNANIASYLFNRDNLWDFVKTIDNPHIQASFTHANNA
ncbi:D-glycero-alpha-D-manno-heptose-1,7-bisphosphate 7-phosphatase [Hirschia litorea]|uniref:D,D-heptose 1,7-bisphosphate phosphatase n=1 Tax=Hirschia litorea TaxID=1199156 RepID=A0ABW2IJX8_9PROT